MNKTVLLGLTALLVLLPVVLAANFTQPINATDQATYDQILSPVMKVYSFVKYAATVLAVLFLVFAGVTFILSGNDQGKRDQAKNWAGYIVIGLAIIWVAPIVVGYIAS